MKRLLLLLPLLTLIEGRRTPYPSTPLQKEVALQSHRDPKMMYLPFIKVVIPPEPCGTESNGVRDGTCLPRGKCDKLNGQRSGDCSMGFGECCRLVANCTADQSRVFVDEYVATLRSPEPPTASCTFKIRKRKDVCQVRLDFKTFSTSSANLDGNCEEDRLTISNSITVPDGFTTCGELRDQHMYLSFGSQDSIDITPRILRATSRYEIIVSQIPCLSRRIVPSYCLQYYNKTTDMVRSFDYGNTGTNQQQNNQMYTICVEAPETSKAIKWRTCTSTTTGGNNGVIGGGAVVPTNARSFFVSSDIAGDKNTGAACTTDWIEINGDAGRRCGETFPDVTSAWKPYTVNVNFDAREAPDYPSALPKTPITTEPQCLAAQVFSGNVFECIWDPTLPPGRTDGCTCTPNKALASANIMLERLFATSPDVGNTGFCLIYEV